MQTGTCPFYPVGLITCQWRYVLVNVQRCSASCWKWNILRFHVDSPRVRQSEVVGWVGGVCHTRSNQTNDQVIDGGQPSGVSFELSLSNPQLSTCHQSFTSFFLEQDLRADFTGCIGMVLVSPLHSKLYSAQVLIAELTSVARRKS